MTGSGIVIRSVINKIWKHEHEGVPKIITFTGQWSTPFGNRHRLAPKTRHQYVVTWMLRLVPKARGQAWPCPGLISSHYQCPVSWTAHVISSWHGLTTHYVQRSATQGQTAKVAIRYFRNQNDLLLLFSPFLNPSPDFWCCYLSTGQQGLAKMHL